MIRQPTACVTCERASRHLWMDGGTIDHGGCLQIKAAKRTSTKGTAVHPNSPVRGKGYTPHKTGRRAENLLREARL